jgi:hypothetical protein
MPESRQLLKSIVPHPDESIQSIAIRLAPLALATTEELLRFGLHHSALSSLPTNSAGIDNLAELGGFDAAEMRGRSANGSRISHLQEGSPPRLGND